MTDLILTTEPLIRMSFFLGILLVMALWEVAAPRRRQEIPRLLSGVVRVRFLMFCIGVNSEGFKLGTIDALRFKEGGNLA